ncbi:hypothetical protein DFA_04723 [Cavenderia fasciculata]|uniref:Uncharacterized protein n=1 Tax=Cavenderia fasciculata TaxID=261658 RepID=F4PQD0_CACFS|nr:uncharacterized protein DFA_04723 [Cavenderia fasciculata]EGG22593.1 hypothetical protein DFA_04723 [Cavenderia fasciculata]|eukprot:XP_004360444.1 hypothetical protein DFA_04723 [Cavenderia fasciculata]
MISSETSSNDNNNQDQTSLKSLNEYIVLNQTDLFIQRFVFNIVLSLFICLCITNNHDIQPVNSQVLSSSELSSAQWIVQQYQLSVAQDSNSMCISSFFKCGTGTDGAFHLLAVNVQPRILQPSGTPSNTLVSLDLSQVTSIVFQPFTSIVTDPSLDIMSKLKNMPLLQSAQFIHDTTFTTIPNDFMIGKPILNRIKIWKTKTQSPTKVLNSRKSPNPFRGMSTLDNKYCESKDYEVSGFQCGTDLAISSYNEWDGTMAICCTPLSNLNNYLPSISGNKWGLFNINGWTQEFSSMTKENKITNTHEKLAIPALSDPNHPNGNLLCLGDSNRSPSQFNHAGNIIERKVRWIRCVPKTGIGPTGLVGPATNPAGMSNKSHWGFHTKSLIYLSEKSERKNRFSTTEISRVLNSDSEWDPHEWDSADD